VKKKEDIRMGCCHKPRNARNHQELEKARKDL
jgi:hypothetical protein